MNKPSLTPIRQLHWYIIGGCVIWLLFIFSFIWAWHRVKDDKNFTGQPFHSFELDAPSLHQPSKK